MIPLNSSKKSIDGGKQDRLAVVRDWLDVIPVAMIVADEDGQILSANGKAKSLLKYSEKELIVLTLDDLLSRLTEKRRGETAVSFKLISQTASDETLGAFRAVNYAGQDLLLKVSASRRNDEDGSLVLCAFEDLSDRLEMETATRESVEMYRLLFETMTSGVVFQDRSGAIIDANSAAESLLGLTISQMQGRDSFDPRWQAIREDGSEFPGDAHPAMVALKTGQPVSDVLMGIFNPVVGTLQWLNINAVPRFRTGETEPYQVYTTFENITARKKVEDELRETEGRFRAMIENAPDGIVLIGSDSSLKYASPSARRLFSYAESSLTHWQPSALTHPDDLPTVLGELQALLADSSYKPTIQYRFQLPNGDYRWLESTFSNLLNVPGVEAIVINYRDIHERKLAEEAAATSHGRLLKFASQVPGMLYQIELQANGRIRVPFSTEAIRDIYGCSPEEVFEDFAPIASVIHPDDMVSINEKIEESARTLKSFKAEYRINIPGQTERWVLAQSTPEKLSNGSIVWSGFNTDITEQKKSEEAFTRSQGLLKEAQRIGRIGHMAWDGRDKVLICSDMLYEIFGLPRGMVITQYDIAKMMAPEEKDRIFALDHQAFTHKTGTDYEYCLNMKDGSRRWVHQIGSINYDENGNPSRMLAVVQDVTERKQTEIALRDSEERFRSIFQSSNAIMLLIEPDSGRIVDSNEAASVFYGYSHEQLVQMNIEEINILEPHQVLAERQKAKQEERSYFIFPHRLSDGRVRTVEVRSHPIKTDDQVLLFSIVYDITESKKNEEKLHESQQRIEMALKGANSATWDWNIKTGEAVFNERWAEILGYQLDELEPVSIKTWWELCHPEDLKISKSLFERHFTKQSDFYEFETRMHHKNGAWIWAADRGKVMEWDEEGNPVRMFGTRIDITNRKREDQYIQARLRLAHLSYESKDMESLMRAMLDEVSALTESSIGFFHFIDDDQNSISLQTWSTNTLENMCTAEGAGMHYPVADAGVWADGLRRGEPVIYNDYPALSNHKELPAGHAPVTRLISIPIKRDNMVLAVIGLGNKPRDYDQQDLEVVSRLAEEAFNIVLRKRVETALQASEEKYRLLSEELEVRVRQRTAEVQDLYDNAPAGYHSLDENGKVLSMNRTELNWLGYSWEEVIGHPFVEFVTGQSVKTFAHFFPEFKKRGALQDLELELIRKNGTVMPVVVNASAVLDEGGVYLFSRTTLFDNTERKVAEEALRDSHAQLRAANNALQKASQTKNDFLANMSHELRTPLNGILGMSEVLLTEMRGPLNDRQRNMVSVVDSSGRHLLSLINDILDLSKIEAGKLDIHFEQVLIGDVCQGSLAFIKEPAIKKGVVVEYLPDSVVTTVMADSRRLKQILVNLLTNAVKFTPAKGKVTLKVQANTQKRCIDLSVSDTGIGIDINELDRLFKPFSQVDNSLTRKHEGTGLGLALVKELTELHGGGIQVSSEVGRGSTFIVSIPWQQDYAAQESMFTSESMDQKPATNAPAKTLRPTEKILLVDDLEVNILTVGSYLSDLGYNMIYAVNGLDAIEKAREHLPNLILMDIQMPEMDGLEATRQLRADNRFARIPIVALTALAMTGDVERCMAAGATEYLSKPVSLKKLADLIRSLLESSKR